jgi:hypothetical protein
MAPRQSLQDRLRSAASSPTGKSPFASAVDVPLAESHADRNESLRELLVSTRKELSDEAPGLTRQFCKDLSRADYRFAGASSIEAQKLPLGEVHAMLLRECGGDEQLALATSAVAHQGLLAFAVADMKNGAIPVTLRSGENRSEVRKVLLQTEAGSKTVHYRIAQSKDGGVDVTANLLFHRISGMSPADDPMEAIQADRNQSRGHATLSVHIGPGPDYAATIRPVSAHFQVVREA